MKAPSPLLGFNNNVRHKGRVFHIQTEDSGIRHPHVITHLFADGGRILKTTKTSYAEHLGEERLAETVRAMMQEQHKAMFIALRDGQFDYLFDEGAAPPSIKAASKPAHEPVPVAVAPPVEALHGEGSAPSEESAVAAVVSSPLVASAQGLSEGPSGSDPRALPVGEAVSSPEPVVASPSAPDARDPVAPPVPEPAAEAVPEPQRPAARPAPAVVAAAAASSLASTGAPNAPARPIIVVPPPVVVMPPAPAAAAQGKSLPAPQKPLVPRAIASGASGALGSSGAPVSHFAPTEPQRAAVIPTTPALAGHPPSAVADVALAPPSRRRGTSRPTLDVDPGAIHGVGSGGEPSIDLDLDALERAAAEAQTPFFQQIQDLPPPPAAVLGSKRASSGGYSVRSPLPPPAGPEGAARAPATPQAAAPSPVRAAGAPIVTSPAAPSFFGAPSPGRYAPSRPASIFATTRPQEGASIFGEDLISEKSLDEVILSYLAEDLDGPPEKK